MVSPSAISVGDVLRDLDAKQLIKSDFILVSGDVVSNLDLSGALAVHKKRRVVNKDAIMTMVLRQAHPLHKLRSLPDAALYAIDSTTTECLHYTPIQPSNSKRRIKLPLEKFQDSQGKERWMRKDVQFRNDLIDCQIDICSFDVPPLFTENFDYQDLRRDFVHGILTSDLLGKRIYCHVVNDKYAARVRSLQTYDAVSQDIISRATYPIVPDTNLFADTSYQFYRSFIYKDSGLSLERSCDIQSHSVIGRHASIDHDTVVRRSVVGTSCRIGRACIIEDAYIFPDAVIGNDVIVKKAIIGQGCYLGDGCQVEQGSVLGDGVCLAAQIIIPANIKITVTDEIEQAIVGTDGRGTVFVDDESEDEEEDSETSDVYQLVKQANNLILSDSSVSSSDKETDSVNSEIESEDERRRKASFAASVTSEEIPSHEEFYREAQAHMVKAFEEDHPVDIAALEMNTLRMASDVSHLEVRLGVVTALMARAVEIYQSGDKKAKSAIDRLFSKWSSLLTRINHTGDERRKTLSDTLAFFEKQFNSKALSNPNIFGLCLRYLYEYDVVEETDLSDWLELNASQYTGVNSVRLIQVVEKFHQQLEEADEDSEGSE